VSQENLGERVQQSEPHIRVFNAPNEVRMQCGPELSLITEDVE